jgi:hypothetical protein
MRLRLVSLGQAPPPSPYYGWPRATTGGSSGVESQLWGFAGQSQTERQALALWEDFERRVLEDLLQQVASCPCALVAEALFTVRHMEPALWIEEVGRREAAQRRNRSWTARWREMRRCCQSQDRLVRCYLII